MYFKRITRVVAMLVVALVISSVALVSFSGRTNAQNQTPTPLAIGVIGLPDSPTAFGVTLAIQRIKAQGPLTLPDGSEVTLNVTTQDAPTAADVGTAITELKKNNVIAIFGPDDDAVTLGSLQTLNTSSVPVFTGATTTALKPGGLIFRTRASDTWQMSALSQVLVGDLKKDKFAIYQGNTDVGEKAAELVGALTKLGKAPSPPVIQKPDGKTADAVQVLLKSNPNAVIAFGTMGQVSEVYRTLRAQNYPGIFVTTYADNPDFINSLPVQLRPGIYGVTTWAYSWNVPDSQDFTRDYVDLFGHIPQPNSAASYDAAIAYVIAVKKAGIAAGDATNAFKALGKANSLQGTFDPTLGNNELSSTVAVVVTNDFGAPTILARFDNTGRLKVIDSTPTFTPGPTLQPSPTPNGVVCTTKSVVNVRNGPGTNYLQVGQLKKGEQWQLIGASADLRFYVIDFRQTNGWIIATACDVFGDLKTLPIVAAPPTPIPSPTPPATLTPVPQAKPDIIMVSATLNPPVPQPNQPFVLSVVIKNNGGMDAGTFAVGVTFQPGNHLSAQNLPGLAAGQTATVSLSGNISQTTVQTVDIGLDFNNQVDEGPNGEANNHQPFPYRIDHSYLAQGHKDIVATSSVDFEGGSTFDISWDGNNMTVVGAAKIGVLSGVSMSQVHYDMLTASTVHTAPIPRSSLNPDTVVAIYTAEGNRGVLHITGYSGTTIQLDYFIYNN